MTAARFLLPVATLLVAACASVSQKVETPEVTLESVRVVRIVDNRAEISMGLKLFNPNGYAIAIKGLDYELSLDGRQAATGRTTRVETLPPRGEGKVDLSGRVDVGAIATSMMALGSQIPVNYSLKGTLSIQDWAPIPFSRSGKIPVTRFDSAFGSRPQ
jgi:LEA14-like dessication related protein